jgi:hypothetical protein
VYSQLGFADFAVRVVDERVRSSVSGIPRQPETAENQGVEMSFKKLAPLPPKPKAKQLPPPPKPKKKHHPKPLPKPLPGHEC